MNSMRISTLARLIAVAAIDLAFIRSLPSLFLLVPFIEILFASINLVLVQAFVLRRPLGLFHLGFVGAGVAFGVGAIGRRTHVIETFIAGFRMLGGDEATWRFNSGNQILFAEQILLVVLGLLACLAAGALAASVGRRLHGRIGRSGTAASLS